MQQTNNVRDKAHNRVPDNDTIAGAPPAGNVGTGQRSFSVFAEERKLAGGSLETATTAATHFLSKNPQASVLVFDDTDGRQVDIDLRHGDNGVRRAHPVETPLVPVAPTAAGGDASRGPGRPRIGVVAREVTLLPRHWDWLNAQPGGASVALRKLVEAARRTPDPQATQRAKQDSAYRFLSAVSGNRAGYEEVLRAVYAGDRERLTTLVTDWPPDVVQHLMALLGYTTPDSARDR